MSRIRYSVELKDLHGHRFEVSLHIPARILKEWGAQVQLPAWIPGSYMLRDFSKHIETISAKSIATKKNISLEKIDSNTWFVPPSNHDVTVSYQVYGFDTSVRAAYIDTTRAFFNPSSLCLQVLDHADEVHELEILKPSQHASSTKAWRIEATLPAKKTDSSGFGIYQAESYDFLIDHPFAIGEFQTITWQSCGTPHRMVIQGATKEVDVQQLAKDLKAICDAHIQFFEPKSHRAPFQQYSFIVNAVGEGYGGLEHRDSTALLCKRDDLPYPHQNLNKHDAYEDFLGLCSHEYFHAWMVKRIKPKAFIPYTLDQKNHTRLLWLFEGFTSYYDDLQLFRSKRIDLAAYLKRLEKTWNMVLRQPGRQKQSVADSSFDAWTKYYQMDENTPNAVVSYYTKGSLIALALDLMIRQHTRHQQSLDDVIRHLWQMYQLTQEGMAENDFDSAIAFIIGPSFQTTWKSFKSDYIEGTKDLPLMKLLSSAKIKVASKIKKASDNPESAKQLLGIRTTVNNGWVKLSHVLDGGLAQKAGLSAGDYLASIQHERVTPSRIDELLTQLILEIVTGKNVKVVAFRHETAFTVNLSSSSKEMLSLQPEQFSLTVA
jgi:predicted metalloprotease with PDZ domain